MSPWRRRRRVVPASSEVQVALPPAVALHARPAATFVKAALRFRAKVAVGANGRVADAKSILSVLALGAKGGTVLELSADGDDASAALDALSELVSGLTE